MILEYFQQNYPEVKNLGDITWAHAVNSKEKAARYIDNPEIMVIESDIRMTRNGKVVTAHSPIEKSNQSFEELIQRLLTSRQAIKLDFKEQGVTIHCLRYLQKLDIKQPIILNADILQGNSPLRSRFTPKEFILLCKQFLPGAILSLGWTTTTKGPYRERERLRRCWNFVKIYPEILLFQ